MKRINIYPTLLDAMTYLDLGYSSSAEVIDKINRRPFRMNENMAIGVAFEYIMDVNLFGRSLLMDNPITEFSDTISVDRVSANTFRLNINGDIFPVHSKLFLPEVTSQVLDYLISQKIIKNQVPLHFKMNVGDYEVFYYGNLDYLAETKAIDLKTTGRYDILKYIESSQRLVYPLALVKGGCELTNGMEFVSVTRSGDMNVENYSTSDVESMENQLKLKTENFIDFLEENIDEVENNRIFDKSVEEEKTEWEVI